MLEIDTLLDQIVPAAEAAVVAYGVSVLTRAQDETAGATVRLGQRLLARILNRGADADADPVRVTVTSLADAGADRDMLALRRAELRIALREVLRDSPGLADELSAMLPERPAVQADAERSVALAGNNSGIISTGDGAKNTLHQ
ncbi:hypothetical protein J7E87_20630 [Streptomyces sp. ISL-1]|uniref:hypothetical protein n=1 Tax=Streptomyces sp. ISL-1 TaxID=2817657 RepID=UPI001BE839A2|nr:hypothetical protein [Streptomyces sp. ISL-1]MBT2391773.1 hypothetical protein [Streptomyces sp. ISL-1]